VGAGAQYLVTGDPDLLVVKEHRGVSIVTPRQMWDVLNQEHEAR
jgi:predicted nucleic acid-binding protein